MTDVMNYSNAEILRILHSVDTMAMVGASATWNRPSFFAMKYLQEKGFRVIPVNPSRAGGEILGERVYANLHEIPDQVDMVDIFRGSADALPIARETVEVAKDKGVRILWMQLGVINHKAAKLAQDAGLTVVMDRCPKIEFGRLHTELSWGGFNSRVITAKRRRVSLV